MKKIPTIFRRDPETSFRTLTRTWHPDCEWVRRGEGTPTRKFDGTCVRVDDAGKFWSRREVRPGKPQPPHFDPVEFDPETGKTVGWEPAEQSSFARWVSEACANRGALPPLPPGTYELFGPKVNGNPEGLQSHALISHGAVRLEGVPRDWDGLQAWLANHDVEGIVWHHPDGRRAKIKGRDFGIRRGR